MPKIWAADIDAHRRLVLERLLDAFADLLVERGYDGVTLSAVAARAGLARSAIYNYTADKHRLLLLHVERTVTRFVEDVRRATAATSDPTEQLAIYVRRTLRSFAEEAGAGQDLLPWLSPEDHAELLTHLRPVRQLAADIIAGGLADGTFRGGGAAELATLVDATLAGYRTLVGQGAVDSDTAAPLVTRVLLHGLTGDRADPAS
jgi:AcrR family transcriptional regulator